MIKAVLKDYANAEIDENGEIVSVPEKTFIQPIVTSRFTYRALEIHAAATDEDSKMTEYEVMTDMMALVTDMFKEQFTFDDILDGVSSEDLGDWLRDIVSQAMTKDKKKAQLKKKAVAAQK
ncbi:phage tail assembly chaperone G [Bacillus velezensis]|uniref:phage tail assembly chaperone G n=1 Tax=Bacillus velezensis TaxID=492670 RepID=UPI003BAB45E7